MALDKPNKDSSMSFRLMVDQSTDYRIVVLGSAGVGKTNCVLRFVNGNYRENYIPTVEDTYRQVVSCNKQITTLQITDTTGTHQFPAMQRLSIQKGHAFILAYSITSKQSFEDLKPIYNQIREIKNEQQSEIPILLMGCKLDESACREVTENAAKQCATQWSSSWIETSAKNNTNIREAFQELLKLDKKRQFNFNVDQDGHLIDDNGTLTSSSPSPHSNKRTPTANPNLATNMNDTSGNSPSLPRTTTPTHNRNMSNRTSIMSTSSTSTSDVKKHSRTPSYQTDLVTSSNASKQSSPSDKTTNRKTPGKCQIM